MIYDVKTGITGVFDGVTISNIDNSDRDLNIFEELFEKRYRVSFERFVEAVLEDHPEIKI